MVGEVPVRHGTRAAVVKPTVIALAALIVASGSFVLVNGRTRQEQTPAYVTAPVTRGDLAIRIAATGPIAAANSTALSFKAGGKIARVLVQPGDEVKASQVLAVQDRTDLQAALDQANASLVQARGDTSVAVAQSGIGSAEADLAAARTALASAQEQRAKALSGDRAAVENAAKSLEAVKASVAADATLQAQLVEKARDDLWATQIGRDGICGNKTIPQFQCDAANASVGAAETNVNVAIAARDQGQRQGALQIAQAQAQLDQAQAQLANDIARHDATVTSADSQIRQRQAALAAAQANLADVQARATATEQGAQAAVAVATANLEATVLRAPFDGTVAAVNGAVGQWVGGGTGTGALIQIVDLSALKVVAQVNEADMAQIKTGNSTEFTVNAFPGLTFTGKVTMIEPVGSTQQNMVTYNVTCAVDPTAARLLPGMTANVNIAVEGRKDAVVVPAAAIAFAQAAGGGAASPAGATTEAAGSAVPAKVLVLLEGKVAPKTVLVGLSDGHFTEIVSGLDVGDTVVTGGSQSSLPADSRKG